MFSFLRKYLGGVYIDVNLLLMLLFSGVHIHYMQSIFLNFWKRLKERGCEPWTEEQSLHWKRNVYFQKFSVIYMGAREGSWAESSWKDLSPTAAKGQDMWVGSEKLGPAGEHSANEGSKQWGWRELSRELTKAAQERRARIWTPARW